jgi:DNA-binding transcriptional LysR family regulator
MIQPKRLGRAVGAHQAALDRLPGLELPQSQQAYPIICAYAVVVRTLCESQREKALLLEVGFVNAGEAARDETGKAMHGEVTIACVPTIGVQYLPRVIQEYSGRHPDNRIRILDHSSSGVAEAVLRREAEFGINIAGAYDAALVSVPLVRDRFVLICRADHPLARRRQVSWGQLEPYPLIFAGQASGNRPLLELALSADSPRLRAYYEVQRSSTALGLVAEGVGAAVVPSLAMQKDAYPKIRVVALVEPVVSRSIALISPKNAHLSPAAQALYDVLLRHARSSRAPAGRAESVARLRITD